MVVHTKASDEQKTMEEEERSPHGSHSIFNLHQRRVVDVSVILVELTTRINRAKLGYSAGNQALLCKTPYNLVLVLVISAFVNINVSIFSLENLRLRQFFRV